MNKANVKKHIIIALGWNVYYNIQMTKAKKILKKSFPDIVFTDVMYSAAYGQENTLNARDYANMMASCTTRLNISDLNILLKNIETSVGNTPALRSKGIVMMDIDLMKYKTTRYHISDWSREYIMKLYSQLRYIISVVLLFLCFNIFCAAAKTTTNNTDSELLGKAIEYYVGGKYHESILLFEKIKKTYRLNPRFLAYLGFSYYKENNYKEASKCLQTSIPSLTSFSPKEQSVYIYACAESLFMLHKYKESMRYYDMLIPLTVGNDMGDVLFHKAFSIYFDKKINEDITDSIFIRKNSNCIMECYTTFQKAVKIYKENRSTATSLQVSRLKQCEVIIKGFEQNFIPFIQ